MADRIREAAMRLGGGGRFKHLKRQMAERGAQDPAALAAWIGRRKYGAKRFAKLSAAGRREGKA
jgi:hypothetical protein